MVIVIGAGVVGCAIAHELSERGERVRVVDPRPIAAGATHASAGMLAPYSEGHDEGLLSLGLESLALYDGFVERVRHRSRHAFEYERNGTWQVAVGDSEATRLSAEAAKHQGQGVGCEWVDGATLRDAEPSITHAATGGLLLPMQGYVDAAGMTKALADSAQRRGAHFTTERVLGLHSSATTVSVTTSEGTLDGDALVLAAGSWSSAVAGVTSWPPPVKPIRGQLLHLRTPSRPASRILWGSACYVVPWHDGTLLVGATVEDAGFDEQPTAGGVRHLLNAAHALMPSTAAAAFGEVRVGLRPKTPDELPIIGPSSTMRRVFHATGHYRNGILLTPLTAVLIADLVLDVRDRGVEGARRKPGPTGRSDAVAPGSSRTRHLALTNPARFGL